MKRKKQLKKSKPKHYVYGAALSVVVFIASAVFATNDGLSWGEQSLFHLFFDLPIDLLPLLLIVTQFGSAWMVVVAVATAIIQGQRQVALKLFLAGVTTYALVELAKVLIHRPRPFFFLPEILHREIFVRGYGFPSGHTAMATAVSLTLLPYIPHRYHFIVPLWICGVGLSRIYLGVHSPLDVVGGFALGLFVACVFQIVFLARRLRV